MANTINARWHASHPMPKPATLAQRVRWHLAHAAACGCRAIPKTVVVELKRQGRAVPRRSSSASSRKGAHRA